jgi:ATP synthase F1 delta subunit
VREVLTGYATATLESAEVAGELGAVVEDLAGFHRALVTFDLLRNVLTDPTVPSRSRRAIVSDLLEGKASPWGRALVAEATVVEQAPDLPVVLAQLVELAKAARDEGVAAATAAEALGRPAVSARVEGYAARCFEEAAGPAELDEIEDELFRFARVLGGSPELRRVLSDPGIPRAARAAVVAELLEGRARPATVRLVVFCVRAGIVRDLAGALERLAALAAAERGRRVAEVRAAVELDEAAKERLARALGRLVGRPVEVRVAVEPELVGGMVVEVGDVVIDASVRHRLEELRERFARRGADAAAR